MSGRWYTPRTRSWGARIRGTDRIPSSPSPRFIGLNTPLSVYDKMFKLFFQGAYIFFIKQIKQLLNYSNVKLILKNTKYYFWNKWNSINRKYVKKLHPTCKYVNCTVVRLLFYYGWIDLKDCLLANGSYDYKLSLISDYLKTA